MRILEIQTVQASIIRILLEILKDFLDDVTFICTPKEETVINGKTEITGGGITMEAMNAKHTILTFLKLEAKNFNKYVCTKPQIPIGFNVGHFYNLVKSVGSDDIITLIVDQDDLNHLIIRLENKKHSLVTEYKLNLLDLEVDTFKIPPVSFSVITKINTSEFHKICRDMSSRAEEVEIISTGNNLILSCEGDFGSQKTTIGESNEGLKFEKKIKNKKPKNKSTKNKKANIESDEDDENEDIDDETDDNVENEDEDDEDDEDNVENEDDEDEDEVENDDAVEDDDVVNDGNEEQEIIQGTYGLKNLTLFTKCTNLCPTIELYLKNDFPLIIKYEVASLGYIQLALCPIAKQTEELEYEDEYNEVDDDT